MGNPRLRAAGMIATEAQRDEEQPTRRLIWILADDDEEPALKALRAAGIERVMEFSPMNVIDRIGPRAICIVTTARYDVTHPLENIYEAYKRAQEPKKIVLLPVEQLDVYKEPGRSMALEEAVKWFDEYLKQE
jgi:hypothetical protein